MKESKHQFGWKAQHYCCRYLIEYEGMEAIYPDRIDDLNDRWKSSHRTKYDFLRDLKSRGIFIKEIPIKEFQSSDKNGQWFVVVKLVFNEKELIMAIPWTDHFKDKQEAYMHGSIAFFTKEEFDEVEWDAFFHKELYRVF